MELPWVCRNCGQENWVDMNNLTVWPLDRLLHAVGYVCERCEMREAISYTTTSLQEAERKLTSRPVTYSKFPFLFGKLVHKQMGVNERGEAYGKSKHSDMAVP